MEHIYCDLRQKYCGMVKRPWWRPCKRWNIASTSYTGAAGMFRMRKLTNKSFSLKAFPLTCAYSQLCWSRYEAALAVSYFNTNVIDAINIIAQFRIILLKDISLCGIKGLANIFSFL